MSEELTGEQLENKFGKIRHMLNHPINRLSEEFLQLVNDLIKFNEEVEEKEDAIDTFNMWMYWHMQALKDAFSSFKYLHIKNRKDEKAKKFKELVKEINLKFHILNSDFYHELKELKNLQND